MYIPSFTLIWRINTVSLRHNYCDTLNKTGLLMLIDFKKAFDSISWKFIYKVLKFFKFPDSYIKWIKLLNTSSVAAVIQVRVKSDF